MRKLILFCVLLCTVSAFEKSDDVQDMARACPDGFFYFGEAVSSNGSVNTRTEIWTEGEKSPIYSCYKFVRAKKGFSGSSLACNNIEEAASQLVSIEGRVEDFILTSEDFWHKIPDEFRTEITSIGAWTSGIELSPGNWTWFGADSPVDDFKTFDGVTPEGNDDGEVNCLAVRWNLSHNHLELDYSAVPCNQEMAVSLCEVHVYTQTWYVWFYSNWLQILLFVTMLLLIFSACCLFQAMFFRTRVRNGQPVAARRQVRSAGQPAAYASQPPSYSTAAQPPAYSATVATDDSFIHESPAERYMRKGRELMAQVTFFRPASNPEKPPLPK